MKKFIPSQFDHLKFRKPGFLVIGAQRSGTTALFRYLTQHPHIRLSSKKEIHFFDDNYHKGIDWYGSHFPPVGLFDALISGEASPYYLFHPCAPRRAAAHYPAIKLIVLLRNPVDRAYSHYHHNIRRKREARSFEEAISMEPRLLEGEEDRLLRSEGYQSHNHKHFSYVSRGLYVRQLKRWLDFFPLKQFMIIKSETFFKQPGETLKNIFSFIGVRSEKISIIHASSSHGYAPMSHETHMMLSSYFRPFNQQLYALLGTDFGWEKQYDEKIMEL